MLDEFFINHLTPAINSKNDNHVMIGAIGNFITLAMKYS